MSKDTFILHEWEKEKMYELKEFAMHEDALTEGREEKDVKIVKFNYNC